MALSWNEIRSRAATFARDWQNETQENAGAQTFWNEFFHVFGVERKRVAVFEKKVGKVSGPSGRGRIDLLWPGRLIAEHKSRGKDLDSAFIQATDYFAGLEPHERPAYVIVSDFARLRLHDIEANTHVEFSLSDFPQQVERFGFIAGFQQRTFREQDPVNVKAAEQMAKLHDLLEESGYTGHQLELLLVRILFLLFADDTGLFNQNGLFYELLSDHTRKDGSDTGAVLAQLFKVLNTPPGRRQTTLPERFQPFPYVNGALFEEGIEMADFDTRMRELLLTAGGLDWGKISPAIFGSMFQGVMNKAERRALGAHYTSESNILKALGPLFLDVLHAQREGLRGKPARLQTFLDRLPTLRFLDPACGSGNFLILAYRELRRLELDVLAELHGSQQVLDISTLVRVHVGQFYGIEFEEFPAQIAKVAMWLTDHQMNVEASLRLGQAFVNLPLADSAHILHADALETDWEEHLELARDARKLTAVYLVGNPPFIGSKVMSEHQHEQIKRLFTGVKDAGILDYVSGWYFKAARAMHRWKTHYPTLKTGAALVSTNSITQGEQVAPLWGTLLQDFGMHLQFAHRTFRWTNDARGKAAVHCVIVGFGTEQPARPHLFDYAKVDGPATERPVGNLSPYLVDSPTILVRKAQEPLSAVPSIHFGNMPLDGGHLILQNPAERDELLAAGAEAERYLKPLLDAQDFLNGGQRWALWLEGAEPQELRKLPAVLKRVEAVRQWRLASRAPSTQKYAATPTLFRDRKLPEQYVVIPGVSSERREYLPMSLLTSEIVVNNLLYMVPGADAFHFGVLMSRMHMVWLRAVGGRLKSDYRYSKDLVYNTFPFPERQTLSEKQIRAVEEAVQEVMKARAEHPGSSLADLYDPLTMPPALRRAHADLDRAVEQSYRKSAFRHDDERLSFLISQYDALLQQSLWAGEANSPSKGRGRSGKSRRDPALLAGDGDAPAIVSGTAQPPTGD